MPYLIRFHSPVGEMVRRTLIVVKQMSPEWTPSAGYIFCPTAARSTYAHEAGSALGLQTEGR